MFKSQDAARVAGTEFSELDILRNRLGAINQVAAENELQRREIQSDAVFARLRAFFEVSACDVFCVAMYSSLLNRMFYVPVTRQEFAALGDESTFFAFFKRTLAELTAEANMAVLAELPGLDDQGRAEFSRWASTFRSAQVLGNFPSTIS